MSATGISAIFAFRRDVNSLKAYLGMGLKIYFKLPTGGFRRISISLLEAFHDLPPTIKCPEYAGKTMKYALVFLEYKNRFPIAVTRINCGTVRFTSTGRVDREYMDRMEAAYINYPWGSKPKRELATKKFRGMSSWAPSEKEVGELQRLALYRPPQKPYRPYKLKYLGLLSNPVAAIAEMDLGCGFRLEKRSFKEISRLVRGFEQIRSYDADFRLTEQYACAKENAKEIYVIVNEVEFPFSVAAGRKYSQRVFAARLAKERELEQHIESKIKLLRLFTGVDMRIVSEYFYEERRGGKIEPGAMIGGWECVDADKDVETPISVNGAKALLSERTLPFQREYVQLAFENFDHSYKAEPPLAFLSLVMALETLFNHGRNEIGYKIARGVAVLNGETEGGACNLFESVKKFYSKRSELMHTGKHETVTQNDVANLRKIVRESILKVLKLDLPKDKLTDRITRSGFGSFNVS